MNLKQINTNSLQLPKEEDYNDDVDEKIENQKEETLLPNKETKNNNLNELYENNLCLENCKEDFPKMMSCPDEDISSNFEEKNESCNYMNGFPFIPNNYKINSCWSGYVGCPQNHLAFPTVIYGNNIYPPSSIPEETQDPFMIEYIFITQTIKRYYMPKQFL